MKVRVDADEKAAADELEKIQKEQKRRLMAEQSPALAQQLLAGQSRGYKGKTPKGMWVEYRDKRSGKSFYYNLVSRQVQKECPIDFVPDPSKPVKDAIYGCHFYH